MEVKHAYNVWASQYDSNENKTRDLEGLALRETLDNIPFKSCLEIGCGTGKNTSWLVSRASTVLSVDFSEEMLAVAKAKLSAPGLVYRQADVSLPWTFVDKQYDLVSFSLVLEHIEDLHHIFKEAVNALAPGGHIYIGELHPFKQYTGSKARFETKDGLQIVNCFNHNISDFIQAAAKCNLRIVDVNEYFDDNDRTQLPRILTLLFEKNAAE